MSTTPAPGRTVADLRVGETGTVDRIVGGGALRRRLLELGVLRGARIRVVRVAPMGDPIELELRGASLSIRHYDAHSIRLVKGDASAPSVGRGPDEAKATS
ncbi:MAG: ferrous iron transport protein A [Deltaproteobacteria bacterium]|nr:ferrous iron transport protein A [Deltaproteobacteria bacterium]